MRNQCLKEYMTIHYLNSNEPFDFEGGGSVPSLTLAYHCSDKPYNPDGDERKVIWICHALTANSDPEDWWDGLVGKGKLIDTDKFFVICVNMLGSCYGTSGPSSINPETGREFFFDFPKVSVRDIVRSQNIVRESLGIKQIDILIGASIGGFQALEWSIMYPDVMKRAVYIATLSRVTPWLTAFEESQRMALEADREFRECSSIEGAKAGLQCARSIAMLSYRCEDGYDSRQWEESDDTLFADRAASYQRYQGLKLTNRFDAWSYWYLSYSVDSENVGRGRGGVWKALGQIRAITTVISIDTDLIFPPREIKKMADAIPGCKYHEIRSLFGHDGFLLENKQIGDILEPIINASL